jgi:hypothetical protein
VSSGAAVLLLQVIVVTVRHAKLVTNVTNVTLQHVTRLNSLIMSQLRLVLAMSRRPSPAQSDTQSPAPSLAFQRKTLPIKRADGEPLTRADLQYDLLYHIFNDKHPVFTDPHPTLNGHPALTKVCFRDLYINSIVQSPKATKGLKEKMLDIPNFATDFAKLALLVNVGRINTTMSCKPPQPLILAYHLPCNTLPRL